jgi:hypothetical protein
MNPTQLYFSPGYALSDTGRGKPMLCAALQPKMPPESTTLGVIEN